MHKKYYQNFCFIKELDTKHILYQKKNTVFIYRNYLRKIDIGEILDIKKLCKQTGNKLCLSNNVKLSIKLGLDGAYIPSFNNTMKHLSFSLKKDFILLGSAHNLKEIRNKELQKVNLIFLSSIFKKNKNYLGINRFKLISNFSKIKIVALGGINTKNIKKLNLLNVYGIAGINYFSKKKGP